MYRLLLLLALALLPVASANAQGSPPNSQVTQVDTSKYPDISLYVSVTDAQGNPVAASARTRFPLRKINSPSPSAASRAAAPGRSIRHW